MKPHKVVVELPSEIGKRPPELDVLRASLKAHGYEVPSGRRVGDVAAEVIDALRDELSELRGQIATYRGMLNASA